jgi:hypothetical protein
MIYSVYRYEYGEEIKMFFNRKSNLEKRMSKQRRNWSVLKLCFILIILSAIVLSVCSPLRFDFAGGNHRIIPTAIDTDLWGNYKVYYKTSDFTHNRTEDYYYIDKDQPDLAELASQNILGNKEMVVYYDRYIGWKGFTAPKTSPIIRIETVKSNITPIPKSLIPNQMNKKPMNLL